MNRVFLSRRNLLTLLSKLDRLAGGENTARSIIKYRNELDPTEYQQTLDKIIITAVEDDTYYVNRTAGAVYLKDDPKLK